MAELTGSFLVARPVLKDPNFAQTVVLVLGHSDSGAYGVVVNRPGSSTSLPVPVFEGGPCPGPGLILLHGHTEWVGQSALDSVAKNGVEVAPGIFVGDAQCLQQVSGRHGEHGFRFRLFQGYSGWGPGQLEGEIGAGAWAVVPANGQLLFDVPAEELWETLRPRRIPEPSLN